MAIYVKIDGITGNVTHQQHQKWIDIGSMQFGVGRAISTPTGRAANRESSEPSISEITLSRELDGATPLFFKEAVSGKKGKTVEIHLVSTGSPGETYMTYKLENTLISGYSVSANGSGRPSETISLNFSKIEMSYTARDASGQGGDAPRAEYDLATTVAG